MQTNNELRVGGKKRGRPTKDSQGNAVDLQRARGRRAQEAFRARREQHVRSLEQRVSSLEDIIEQMSNTFMTFSDGLLKSRGSQDLALVREVQSTTQRFLGLSQRAVREPDSENDMEPGNASNASTTDGNVDEAQLPVLMREEAFQGLLPDGIGQNSDNQWGIWNETTSIVSNNILPPLQTTRQFHPSPWAYYDLWSPSRSTPCGTDAVSIISYIVAGRDSFASRLYFDTIVLALRSIQGENPEVANAMFGYKLKYVGRHKILEALGGVLETMLRGTNQLLNKWENCGKETSKEDELNNDAVKSAILRETGTSENDYLDSFGVERYLKDTWSLAIDSRTLRRPPQGVLEVQPSSPSNLATTGFPVSRPYKDPTLYAPTLIAGFPQQEQVIYDVQPLLREITYAGITIGQGPRWAKAKVDAIVRSYLIGVQSIF